MIFSESESLSPFFLLFVVAIAMVRSILVIWLNVLLIASMNVLKKYTVNVNVILCYITCNKRDKNVNEI